MARRMPSFESLSPRFSGFDLYFKTDIAPKAPALAAAVIGGGRSFWRRALAALALAYVGAAATALVFYPAEIDAYRPWAIASLAILAPGLLFALAAQDGDRRLAAPRASWLVARGRIADFFGLAHAAAPDPATLDNLVAACPAPPGARALEPEERIVGRIRTGRARGVEVHLIEGHIDERSAALCEFSFPGRAPGVGALLDDRIEGLPRHGLAELEIDPPPGHATLAAYAETDAAARRLTDPAILSALVEFREDMDAAAVNLAIVEDTARLFLFLNEPVYVDGGGAPTVSSVGQALHDYDALVRLAEALTRAFDSPKSRYLPARAAAE